MSNFERILLLAPSWVGDVVMATPAIRGIRKQYPKSSITVVARQTGADVLEHNPHISRIIAADRRGVGPETSSNKDLIAILREQNFDLCVIFPNSFRTGWLAWRSGAERRIGYALQWRSLLLTDHVPPPREQGKIVPINMVDRYLALAAKAGCTDLSKKEELFASHSDIKKAGQILESLGISSEDKLVVLIPGAAFGPAKLWGAEKFAAVADALVLKHGVKVMSQTGPGEEDIAKAIAAVSKNVITPPAGQINLKILKAVMKRASLVISNDTGPRHYAVAFDIPNVVILGPTSRRYIDVNMEKTALLQAEVPCGPCQKKVCPRDHRCMQLITPEQVISAAEKLVTL